MDDIIVAAQNHFHHDQQHLTIHVLEEKKGIFGIGAYVKAKVTLNLDPIEEGKKYLEDIKQEYFSINEGIANILNHQEEPPCR